MRVPRHIGIIPDGNRRWAKDSGLQKHEGYQHGLYPGVEFLRLAKEYGVDELTYYGFTTDNCKRPKEQVKSFMNACIEAIKIIEKEDASLLVVGNTASDMFPKELLPYTHRTSLGRGSIKVNFLVNYGWEWDLNHIDADSANRKAIQDCLKSKEISRIDLVIRWGGRKRLSGFLPVQSVYADIYTIDEMWPDFNASHFYDAMNWYNLQDVTLGG